MLRTPLHKKESLPGLSLGGNFHRHFIATLAYKRVFYAFCFVVGESKKMIINNSELTGILEIVPQSQRKKFRSEQTGTFLNGIYYVI